MDRALCVVALLGCSAPGVSTPELLVTPPPAAGTWRPGPRAPFAAAQMLLLTDGTVMAQEESTESWWKLIPDAKGDYGKGTWGPMASFPTGYSPLYYASAVLPDGNVIAMGGEYIATQFAFSRTGAFYDAIADHWTTVNGPAGWGTIGDASGMVLADGTFLLSDCCTTNLALFDEHARTWRTVGTGKRDINDEESWAMLPDGTILTVDANNASSLTQAEIYDPVQGKWLDGGQTPIEIADFTPGDPNSSHEIGPNVLRYDGTVLAIGGNGHNAIYDTSTKTWATAPDLPKSGGQQLDVADGPAAMLPSGNVLLAASPGVFNPPTLFFEWDGTAFNSVPAPPGSNFTTSYRHTMLVLPTGEILMSDFSDAIEMYTPAGGHPDAAEPVITDAPRLIDTPTPKREGTMERPIATLYPGRSYVIEADQIAGLTQGGYYGDDVQAYTNYPLVRLTGGNGDVKYCRTYGHSTRSVAPGTHGSTDFDVPLDAPGGLAKLEIVVNGIASPAISVNVKN